MSTKIATAALTLLLLMALAPLGASAQDDEVERIAVEHMAAEYGHSAADLEGVHVTDLYASAHNDVTHVYLRQAVDDTPVVGAVATVNIQEGVVVHSGSRFIHDIQDRASGQQAVPADVAIDQAAAATDSDDVTLAGEPELVYQRLDDGTARLAYRLQLTTPHHWWDVAIDAETGEVLYLADWVDHEDMAHIAASTARQESAATVAAALAGSDALAVVSEGNENAPIYPPEQAIDGSSYNIFPMPLESPLDGTRRIVDNPADASASPYGWHDTDGEAGPEYTITRGNNVNAYADTVEDNEADPASQPDGGSSLDFDNPLVTFDATPAAYRDAAVTNLFYWNNVMHDVTHRYGFTEEAGNFQETNYTGAGLGGDAVLAEAQDGGFVLNANFATPPDGSPGRMQMYLWVDAFRDLGGDIVRVHSHQVRDGDVDAGVIAHEYGHGVSNRLVGGPSNVSCLRTHDEREGEGWSDWWSYVLTMREGDDGATPRGIGNYVVYYDEFGRNGPGIRITPYSTDLEINPSTYNTIRTAAEPHGVGYVWATILWDLYWNLVEVHGFNPNPYESWDTGGNNLAMQLVLDGMKMGPCAPGFVDARDAIIAADAALTGDVAAGVPGDNECLIWRTFARRGVGLSADQGDPASKVDQVEGFDVPAHCETAG